MAGADGPGAASSSAPPRSRRAARRPGSRSIARRPRTAPRPRSRRWRSGPSRPACRHASSPGPRRSRPIEMATRSPHVTIACCSSTCRRLPHRPPRACSRPRCGRSSVRLRGVPAGCCSPPVGPPGISSDLCGSSPRSRGRSVCRSSSCPRSTTTTSACTWRATTNGASPTSKPGSCTERRWLAPTAI